MGAFDVAFRFKGNSFKNVQMMLKKTGKTGLRLAKFELTKQAGLTLGLAANKAPRDTSMLRINTRVLPAKIIRNERGPGGGILPSFIRAGFVFLQKYAEVQHENLTYRHQEGEAKFAEKALLERQRAIFGGIERVLRRLYSSLR